MGSKRLAELPDAFSSCTSSRAPCSRGSASRSGSSPRSPARRAGCVVFEGRADHAGTTPMDARADALVEAARFILHVRECARDGTVATVGAIEVEPNAVERRPRAGDGQRRRALAPTAAQLDALVAGSASSRAVALRPGRDGRRRSTLRGAARTRRELVSGAGTTRWFVPTGVPTAMLFVRSLNGGVSHHPDELSSEEDIALAVDALTAALDRLAR